MLCERHIVIRGIQVVAHKKTQLMDKFGDNPCTTAANATNNNR